MKIELRNIKVMPSMSQETYCYNAKLYVDGQPFARVFNHGEGGPDGYDNLTKLGPSSFADKLQEISKWLEANMPPVRGEDYALAMDLELFCGEAVSEHLMKQDLQRAMRSKVLHVTPDGRCMETRFKGCRKVEQRHIDYVAGKNPANKILNNMPIDEALPLYKQSAA